MDVTPRNWDPALIQRGPALILLGFSPPAKNLSTYYPVDVQQRGRKMLASASAADVLRPQSALIYYYSIELTFWSILQDVI